MATRTITLTGHPPVTIDEEGQFFRAKLPIGRDRFSRRLAILPVIKGQTKREQYLWGSSKEPTAAGG